MTSPLVAREAPPSRPFIFVPPIDEKYQWKEPSYDYEDWGDILTDIDKYGGSWPNVFDKNPKKSPTIGPYPEIGNDDFKQKFEWISKSDLPPEMKEKLLGTLAQQFLLPKGKVMTPEDLKGMLDVASPYFKDAVMTQAKNLENIARQKAIYSWGDAAIEGARAVATMGLPNVNYVTAHGLNAGLGKPSNIMRTYFG